MLKSSLTVLALFILVGIAACGGSGDETPETITPAETDDSAISLTPTPTAVLPPSPTPIPTATPVATATPPTPTEATTTTEVHDNTDNESSGAQSTQVPTPTEAQTATPDYGDADSESNSGECTPPPTSTQATTTSPDYRDTDGESSLTEASSISFYPAVDDFSRYFLYWTLDGSHLVFNFDSVVYLLDAKGTNLQTIINVEIPPEDYLYEPFPEAWYYFHADVSPDGCRIVYSTHAYWDEPRRLRDYSKEGDLDLAVIRDHNYEIAVSQLDGTAPQRLTANRYWDQYPSWSPDGTRIAFISTDTRDDEQGYTRKIYTMSANGINRSKSLTPSTERIRVSYFPPKWSPDGEWLAFIATETLYERPRPLILYTVRADGTELTRIGEVTAQPTWSPNSNRLTFAVTVGGVARIYTVRPDGTQIRTKWLQTSSEISEPVSQVAWSSDGSELLFIADQLYLVDAEDVEPRPVEGTHAGHWEDDKNTAGSGLRSMEEYYPCPGRAAWAAWSPDGSQIALVAECPVQWEDNRAVAVYVLGLNDNSRQILMESFETDDGLHIRLAQ